MKKARGGIIVLDVLLTGLIGVVVDAATGSWNKLTPDQVSVSLEKEDMGVIGPDKIDITVSGLDDEDGTFCIDCPEIVQVSIEKI